MLIILKAGRTRDELAQVQQLVDRFGVDAHATTSAGQDGIHLCIAPSALAAAATALRAHPAVADVVPDVRARLAVGADTPGGGTRAVRAGRHEIRPGTLTVVAGPCAVESEEQLLPLARRLAAAGVDMLRGGAYKPRSSPYDFQGLGEPALALLARAREETGLPIVTEAVDEASFERVEAYADMVQIGARNMHNYSLLKRAAVSSLPVFLKRGMSATLDDLLLAAEYVLAGGNESVVLCERGIRTFSDHSRFTLDLSIVPRLKPLTHLPIFVDPSHACGRSESVAALAAAAVAAGADGVMIEGHPDPDCALCDGRQSLSPAAFESLLPRLRAVAALVGAARETVS